MLNPSAAIMSEACESPLTCTPVTTFSRVVCLQVLKWNFITPREEFVDQLKTQMAACMAKWLMEDLFHTDFQKHIKAISTMMEVSLGSVAISFSFTPCKEPYSSNLLFIVAPGGGV